MMTEEQDKEGSDKGLRMDTTCHTKRTKDV